MRYFLSLLVLPVLTLAVADFSRPAWADDPAKPEAMSAHHPRETWQQHFTKANLAHDGHLTLEDAKAGYPLVAKHFEDIDADHKGYVTENDIRAWQVMRKAAHRLAHPPQDRLKPRNAMQLGPVEHRPVTVSATQAMAVPPVQGDRN